MLCQKRSWRFGPARKGPVCGDREFEYISPLQARDKKMVGMHMHMMHTHMHMHMEQAHKRAATP